MRVGSSQSVDGRFELQVQSQRVGNSGRFRALNVNTHKSPHSTNICHHLHMHTQSAALVYTHTQTFTHMRTQSKISSNVPGVEGTTEEERGTPPAAFIASFLPLMEKHNNSSIQKRGGDEEAKHEDGDTKNVIRSSHSRVLVQYGISISGNCSSKSL